MSTITIRTRDPKTEGGNLDDVQISFKIEAIDEDGNVLYSDHLWLGAKGVQNDPVKAAAFAEQAAAIWAEDSAQLIADGAAKFESKADEIATAKPLLDAIVASADVIVTKEWVDAKVSEQLKVMNSEFEVGLAEELEPGIK